MMLWILACTNASKEVDSGHNDNETTIDECSLEEEHLRVGLKNCGDYVCRIEEGYFQMGSHLAEDSCPVRDVWLSSFRIDKNEVTVGTWEACVEAGFCEALPNNCMNPLYDIIDYKKHPVRCVSWHDAESFCQHYGGRLPTEAQWEKAARGRKGSIYPWGNTAPDCSHANFRLASLYCFHGGTAPVGSYSSYSSVYGVNDLAGNVFEWVSDFYDVQYYAQQENTDPEGPKEFCLHAPNEDREECKAKVMRGGAYNSTEHVIRSFSRSFASPETKDINIGFRCVYD